MAPGNREVALVSVPHTGTIFTVNLFVAQGFDNLNLNKYPAGRDCIFYDHCIKPTQVRFALDLVSKGLPLVCPLRHPYLTEEAWKLRGKDLSDMVLGFRNLMEHFAPLEPYWMPVDSEARFDCIERMAEGLGLPLQTDWAPKHVFQQTHGMDRDHLSPSREVRALVEEMEPLLSRLY